MTWEGLGHTAHSRRVFLCWEPQYWENAQSHGKPQGDGNLFTWVTKREKGTTKGRKDKVLV